MSLFRTEPVASVLPFADLVGFATRRKVPSLRGWQPLIPHKKLSSSSQDIVLVASIKRFEHNKIFSDILADTGHIISRRHCVNAFRSKTGLASN
jgi:hypothetical protein